MQAKEAHLLEEAKANFDVDLAMKLLYASSASYCHQEDIATFTCPPCKSLDNVELFKMTLSTTVDG